MFNNTHDWKPCGECGTLLQINNGGHYDCPKCNIENFLFPFGNKKEEKENEIKEKLVPQDQEKIQVEI